jgi:hypothetical protein
MCELISMFFLSKTLRPLPCQKKLMKEMYTINLTMQSCVTMRDTNDLVVNPHVKEVLKEQN